MRENGLGAMRLSILPKRDISQDTVFVNMKALENKIKYLVTMEYYLVKISPLKIFIDFYIGLIHYQSFFFLESHNYFLIKQGVSMTLFIIVKYICIT